MIKDKVITVEYNPKARPRFRFRHYLWKNGKITRTKCNHKLITWERSDLTNFTEEQRKYPIHIPFSTVLAQIIKWQQECRVWIKLMKEGAIYDREKDKLFILDAIICNLAKMMYFDVVMSKQQIQNKDYCEYDEPEIAFQLYAYCKKEHDEQRSKKFQSKDAEAIQRIGTREEMYRDIMNILLHVKSYDFLKTYELMRGIGYFPAQEKKVAVE